MFSAYRFYIIDSLHSGITIFIHFAAGQRAVFGNFAAGWVPKWPF
jgi:hypothetical protein